MLEKSIRSGHSGERVMDTTSAIEMTMSVTGDERTEHSATTAAGGVTYWATEFERLYFMRAARIRGRPRGRSALSAPLPTMSLENSGSASRFDAQTNGGIHDP